MKYSIKKTADKIAEILLANNEVKNEKEAKKETTFILGSMRIKSKMREAAQYFSEEQAATLIGRRTYPTVDTKRAYGWICRDIDGINILLAEDDNELVSMCKFMCKYYSQKTNEQFLELGISTRCRY